MEWIRLEHAEKYSFHVYFLLSQRCRQYFPEMSQQCSGFIVLRSDIPAVLCTLGKSQNLIAFSVVMVLFQAQYLVIVFTLAV